MTFTRLTLIAALFFAACETTPEGDDGLVEGETVHIPASDMEPVAEFIHRTRRILVAEYVRVEMSAQFYEGQLGLSRDIEYVKRTDSRLDDGSLVISLKRVETGQETNLDPNRLPRLYFGKGLEARAFNELRIVIRHRVDKNRPIFLKIQGVTTNGDSKLHVSGREQDAKPRITIESSLLFSEKFEHYKHRSAIY